MWISYARDFSLYISGDMLRYHLNDDQYRFGDTCGMFIYRWYKFLCQWVWHLEDGTRQYIEGNGNEFSFVGFFRWHSYTSFFFFLFFGVKENFIIETEKYTINYEEEKAPQKKRKTTIKNCFIYLVNFFHDAIL